MSDSPISGPDRVDVIVVGAGPVGLDLACRLAQLGISCRLLEKRTEPTRHSRSIGIHAPALEALAEIGVAGELVDRGVSIREGIAFSNSLRMGTLSLDAGPPPFEFILAIPQYQTEQILEDRLHALGPGVLQRGVQVVSVTQHEAGVEVRTNEGQPIHGRFLVGCDGQNSLVRQASAIDWHGGQYKDAFVMGDFRDDTEFGPRAVIFLTSQGLVESFPLPGGVRRWVARTPLFVPQPDAGTICKLVVQRTGIRVDPASAQMRSGFQAYRFLASTMASGRVLLAGDAGHVISPIGGQGMNLGWLDSRAAARVLGQALEDPSRLGDLFAHYSLERRRTAKRAARRAEFNMVFGRPGLLSPVVRAAARIILKPPFKAFFARQFTMRGL